MHIVHAGYHQQHTGDFRIIRPNGSGDYLFLIVNTPAYFQIEGKRIEVPASTAMLYKKGTPQFYGTVSEIYRNDWMHFEAGEEDIAFLEYLDLPMDTPFPVEEPSALSSLIKTICVEKYSRNPFREDTLALYIRLLFIKVAENHRNDQKTHTSPYVHLLSDLRTKIYNEPHLDWDINSMAAKLSLSRYYFQHIYKQQFGTGAINDVVNSRVEHAKYLLFSTDMPVHALAEMCGYKNNVHFIRQLKRITGMTPLEYRTLVAGLHFSETT